MCQIQPFFKGLSALSPEARVQHKSLFLNLVVALLTIFLVACVPAEDTTGDTTSGSDDIQLSSDVVYLSEVDANYTVTAAYVDASGN